MKVSRRELLKGSIGISLTALAPIAHSSLGKRLLDFKALPSSLGKGKMPAISKDYEYQVILPWGDPLQPSGPRYAWPTNWKDQQEQIGIGHDGMAYFALGKDRGLLVINHEYGRNPHVLGLEDPKSLDHVRASQAAHGVSIVEVAKEDDHWKQKQSKFARRIHVNSPVEFSGPAAQSDLLKNPANNPYLGTVSNCANGRTPWGTYLTCEENFNFFFESDKTFTPTPAQKRYGFSMRGGRYGWHRFDQRFNLNNDDYKNEGNRFGWVVEVDPTNAGSLPIKRTGLGRFKHEGAAVVENKDGRISVYMGDDSRFEFIYKYVSPRPWRDMHNKGVSPLDSGELFVAHFSSEGAGVWLKLHVSHPILKRSFKNQAEVLINARLAASLVGATPMDRPEWMAHGADGFMYCSLTNNTRRQVPNAPNPQAPNLHGHIIRFLEEPNGKRFTWNIFMSGENHYESETSFSSPDGLWADPEGRLFIQTDGDQRNGLNNQLLVADINNGEIRRLLTGVPGCEITGIASTPDQKTMFVNIQHPGGGDPSITNFPRSFDGVTVPRDCTLAIRRKNGGVVGS